MHYHKNRLRLFTLLGLLVSSAMSGSAKSNFALGADISGTTQLESHGIVSYNSDGVQTENTRLMKELGLDAIRLRVWVDPADGFSSPADVLTMARRAKAEGMDIMIDFHYSDWWADPGKQNIPKAWEDKDYEAMCKALAEHTQSTLQLLKDDGIDVRWVQIGNETPNGFLWPMAKLEHGLGENMPQYVGLTKAGYDAAKSVYPEAEIIVHLDDAYDRQLYVNMFDNLRQLGCPFDAIGMSVYPYWSKRDQLQLSAVSDVIDNINYLADRYGVDVIITEVGVHADDPESGKIFLSRLINSAIDDTDGRCTGIFYWAPETCHGGYRLGAFDNDRPTVIMDAFTEARAKLDAKSPRKVINLSGDNWQFAKGELKADMKWTNVSVPHDWAVYGPFDRANDLQNVAIEQNGETEESWKTGRTGGLPFMGKGVYRTTFDVTDETAEKVFTLVFDGAMSNPQVDVNGHHIGGWAYGYNSFYLDVPADVIRKGKNTLTVSLENKEQSSRWYPGAGLYRNVRLVITDKVHVPVWGTNVTTPYVSANEAAVKLKIDIAGAETGQKIMVNTAIIDPQGRQVAVNRAMYHAHNQPFVQSFLVEKPTRWSLDNPALYKAVTTLEIDGEVSDRYVTTFGIRSLEYIPEKGFFLNGEYTKMKGVCLHHDLGPLGAAVNRSAMRYQIELLKDIGVNAIRTSHNMPDPQLVELCDEMGVMMMVEPFDDWSFRPKCLNGYGSIFNEWAERDMVNMLHQYRNHASVVMWSIGNEVPSQWGPDGVSELEFLQDICHREDPTRPVTCGMDQATAVLSNGFAAALDIPGFNYKPQFYVEAYNTLPQKLVLGTETASTVSSRGVYEFPMSVACDVMHSNHQSSSYDTEFCFWSNLPELDYAADEDYPWMIGQFVWTGFDYLGEPYPYDTDAWPSHSSLFGIFDLASLPKDRAYLYRSVWNTDDATLHVLPHWTWPGREGEITPVMVYTSWPSAELFVNGVSQGVRTKVSGMAVIPEDATTDNHYPAKSTRESLDRYRLVWDNVVYQPGEIRVVAYDAGGKPVGETSRRTAGKPAKIVLKANRQSVDADADELIYVTVTVVDKNGVEVPDAANTVRFKTSGAGRFVATANGDAASLRSFQLPEMDLFSGACTVIVAPDAAKLGSSDDVILTVTSPGLKSATINIPVNK